MHTIISYSLRLETDVVNEDYNTQLILLTIAPVVETYVLIIM